MLNEFYHEVEISFNFWMIVGPLMALTMGVIGWTRFKMEPDTDIVYERDSEIAMIVIATFLDLLFHTLFVIESFAGIWQVLVNHLDGDILWMPFIMAVVLMTSFVLVYYILYGIGKVGGWLKFGYLIETNNRRRDERRKRIARRFKNIPDLRHTPKSKLEYFSDAEVV